MLSKRGKRENTSESCGLRGEIDPQAEGGVKTLHQVSKPTPWRGGATHSRTTEEDAAEGTRIGATFQEWSKHWHVGEEVQEQDKPWENGGVMKQRRRSSASQRERSKERCRRL